MRHELTEPAERDIRDILRHTLQMFGPRQAKAYAGRGIEQVAQDPQRPGSMARDELAPGLRLLHLEIAAGRRGGSTHCLYYIRGRLSDGSSGVVIIRVLHERMEPRHRIIDAVASPTKGKPSGSS